MAKKMTRNPTTHSNAELPNALDALDALALDELLDFETTFANELADLFNPAGMKELFAALFVILGMFGIAGNILFIF
jgi:hypothetical protein